MLECEHEHVDRSGHPHKCLDCGAEFYYCLECSQFNEQDCFHMLPVCNSELHEHVLPSEY